MKQAKIAFVILLAIGILVLAYFVGYHNGESVIDRQHLAINLDENVYLYHLVDRGEYAEAKSRLGFHISEQLDTYQQRYGDEHYFSLGDARQIAAIAATNGVMIWTNK